MLSDRLLKLVRSTSLEGITLPPGVQVLDPQRGPHAAEVVRVVGAFHRKYFHDDRPRKLMLGINPGRLGAGSTGLCFTDTKRCESDLGIPVAGLRTHEPSSDFFYRVVRAMGGATEFYSRMYVQAVCPLGFTRTGAKGAPVNLNYYDDPCLQRAITPFVSTWLKKLVHTGMLTDTVLCIGTGRNLAYLSALNAQHNIFRNVVALEHPRFIMQYRALQVDAYVRRYVDALAEM